MTWNAKERRLTYPLPKGCRIVRVRETPGDPEPVVTMTLSLPWGVVEVFAAALEYAGRVTGSELLGARIAAMGMECLGEWQAQAYDGYDSGRRQTPDAGMFLGLPRGAGGASGAGSGFPPSSLGPHGKASSVASVDGPCLPSGDGEVKRICLLYSCGGLFLPRVPWQSHCSETCRRRDWAVKRLLRRLASLENQQED